MTKLRNLNCDQTQPFFFGLNTLTTVDVYSMQSFAILQYFLEILEAYYLGFVYVPKLGPICFQITKNKGQHGTDPWPTES